MSRGFILVEVSIAYVILTLAMAALIPVFILSIRAAKSAEKIQVCTYLSSELLEEVRLRKWDGRVQDLIPHVDAPSPTLGVDAGETATNKATFDDVDDFNGWSETGARDPLGTAIAEFKDYTRTVAVTYVDATLTPTVATNDLKRITVCTLTGKVGPICLNTLVSNR